MSTRITEENFEMAFVKMARSLSTEHWQAMVVEKGVKFPYTLAEKIKILKQMINADTPNSGA